MENEQEVNADFMKEALTFFNDLARKHAVTCDEALAASTLILCAVCTYASQVEPSCMSADKATQQLTADITSAVEKFFSTCATAKLN